MFTITTSHYNQSYVNGAKERLIWGKRKGGSSICLGVLHKTGWGVWQANCRNLKGGQFTVEGPGIRSTLAKLKSRYGCL